MIRVVDLGFGGLLTTNLRIFRSAGLRTGWSRPICIFFLNENRMHPHPVHNFKKRKRGYLRNFMKDSRGKKNYMRVQEEGMGVEEEFVLKMLLLKLGLL